MGEQMSELVRYSQMKMEFEKIKKYIDTELDFSIDNEIGSKYTWLNQVKEIYNYLKQQVTTINGKADNTELIRITDTKASKIIVNQLID